MRHENDETVEIREYYQRGDLPVRCHECGAPLFPNRTLVGEHQSISAACDGQNLVAHKHVNVYRRMPTSSPK